MDEPLNPFSKGIKIAKPNSRQRHSVGNSPCKLSHSLILRPLTVIGFLIKGVLMGEISLVKPDFSLRSGVSDAFFVSLSSLSRKRKKIEVLGFLISFPSVSSFSSLLSPSTPPPPPYFPLWPLLSATGEILLWDGSLASRGFNPGLRFVISDNPLMEAGVTDLARVNKHRPHTALWKPAGGERKQELRWIWNSDRNATLPGQFDIYQPQQHSIFSSGFL